MTLDELIAYKIDIDGVIVSIRNQIDEAKTDVPLDHDPDWWRRVHAALRWEGWRSATLAAMIGTRRREMRAASHATQQHESTIRASMREDRRHTIENAFLEVARQLLPPDTFHVLLDEAHARLRAGL